MAKDLGHPVPPYGVAIQQAIATGDVGQMREVAQRAQAWVAEEGDLRFALENLKAEIARREAASS